MEQALASDMWGTPQFEGAYIEFLSEFDRLTDGLEWVRPQSPGWYMPRLEGAPEMPCDLLHRCKGGRFDSAAVVASLKQAEKFAFEVYMNIPRHEWGQAALRWGWLYGALGEFNYIWGIK
mgnify:CR=1 FL=1